MPKGAELSHSNLMMNAIASVAMTHLNSHDVSLIALPLFHSFGQSVQMNAVTASGGSMVLLPRFEAEAAMKAMTDHSVTVFCGVPTMFGGNFPFQLQRDQHCRKGSHRQSRALAKLVEIHRVV